MTRILADLPEDDIDWLDRVAGEQGKSRAAVLRQAVSAYRDTTRTARTRDWIERGAGFWKGRTDIGDPIASQRARRDDRTPDEDI